MARKTFRYDGPKHSWDKSEFLSVIDIDGIRRVVPIGGTFDYDDALVTQVQEVAAVAAATTPAPSAPPRAEPLEWYESTPKTPGQVLELTDEGWTNKPGGGGS